MTVKVRYYAVLRELTGRVEEDVELPTGSNGSDLLYRLSKDYPSITGYVPYLRLATDFEYLSPEVSLQEDSVVNVIPPVSGG